MFQEVAFYPAVALLYFFGVMRGTQQDRIDFPESASVNVFCLFVLAQPLCLVIGSYTGMLTYLITALVSYNFLSWKEEEKKEEDKKEEKKEKKKKEEKRADKKDKKKTN